MRQCGQVQNRPARERRWEGTREKNKGKMRERAGVGQQGQREIMDGIVFKRQ